MRLLAPLLVPVLVLALGVPSQVRGEEGSDRPRSRALLVGVTEYPLLKKQMKEATYEREVLLKGPVNDTKLWREVLTRHLGFADRDIVTLAGWSDDPADAKRNPTRGNILAQLEALALSVKAGEADRVVLVMAGHGTQVPDLSGDELDEFDEAFLPADVSRWDVGGDGVPGALLDDELDVAIRRIRDAGAFVWVVMDCCHSGTMVRGGTGGLRFRQLDKDILGIPDVARTRGAGGSGPGSSRAGSSRAGSSRAEAGAESERPETPGQPPKTVEGGETSDKDIVAIYAAQSYHRTPEMRLPRMGEGAAMRGLLSYVLTSLISRLGPSVTFEELYQQAIAEYRALPYTGTSPLAEGDLSTRVDGTEGAPAAPTLLVGMEYHDPSGEKRLSVSAGRLAGIEPATILAVHRPGAPDEILGYVEVVSSELHRAWCAALERDGKVLPVLVGDVRLCPASVVERPLGDYTLRWAVVDAAGNALGIDALPKAAQEALGQEAARRKFPHADDLAAADWLFVVDERGLSVRPAKVGGGDGRPFKVEPSEAANTLARFFRVQNLKRLVLEGQVPPLDPEFVFEIRRVTTDLVTKKKEEHPLGDDALLRPGDEMRIVVQNQTGEHYDLWAFFLDADQGVHLVYPRRGGPRITLEGTKVWERTVPIVDGTRDVEHILVIAIPREEGQRATNFKWLVQPPQERQPGGVTMRGPAEGGAFGDLLTELAFGDGLEAGSARMRGAMFDEGDDTVSATMKLITVTVKWVEPMEAPAFDGEAPTVPVLEPRHVFQPYRRPDTTPWDGRTDAVRFRGDLSTLYAKLAPAVVVVRTRTGHGTGFLIDEKGHVLTNDHVVSGGFTYTKGGRPQVQVHLGTLNDDGFMEIDPKGVSAEIVMTDASKDLALLRLVDAPAALASVPPIPLAEKGPRPGERCVMIGHPASALLWSVRECHASNVGRSPHDFSDVLLQTLSVPAGRTDPVLAQIETMTPVKIVLSSCQANPGDSGGPLVNEKGELLAVTHAIPAEVRTDKFVYHIHLDEVRAFLADRPDPDAETPPVVPEPWRLGPNVQLKRTSLVEGPGFDVLLAGQERPEQVLVDVDGDTGALRPDPETIAKMVAARTFDAEAAFHFFPDRRIAFYDADNDGTFDIVLVDWDEDPAADVRFDLVDGRWYVTPEVDLPWIDTGYLEWIEKLPRKARVRQRKEAVAKFRLLVD